MFVNGLLYHCETDQSVSYDNGFVEGLQSACEAGSGRLIAAPTKMQVAMRGGLACGLTKASQARLCPYIS